MHLTVASRGFVGRNSAQRIAALVRGLERWARAALRAARRHVRSPDEVLAQRMEEWTAIQARVTGM